MTDELKVVRAGFAPIKGTRHLAYDRLVLDDLGVVGDRGFALVSVNTSAPGRGRVLRTVQHPSLVAVRAEVARGRLEIGLPGGESVSAEPVVTGESIICDYWGREVELELLSGPHSELFSRWLDRPVRLARARRGEVVFAGAVSMVTTASLGDLARRIGDDAALVAARFRPNLVVETEEPYVEDTWLGREVQVGAARLRIGVPIPRCAVIDIHPETGKRDVRLLKTLASHRPLNRAGEPALGVFAEVVAPGFVG
ncbi:MOSC domain-containing protein [Nocardioides sp.]|uniref:MOSC domain-containing protein n=1 Tax=Nocardioides sp. TaxID=35761 RepID=UPI00199438FE|nr:MOSC domain-containing protein [Nocardioides sp.]MBC7278268.1 MOSC domain-containing protein [Nocardioides sp.]